MGLLDASCSSLFFQMQCDIYYALENQDKYGKVSKTWNFDSTQRCSFYTLGDESNAENFTFNDNKFYRLETMLFGRIRGDIRKSSSGEYYPASHILITNIRGVGCNENDVFFYETNGDYVGKPTIFEIKMIQPFIGPFGNIEYFKIQLERSDTQGLREIVSC